MTEAPGQAGPGLIVRRATELDHDRVWTVIEPAFRAGDTYTLPADIGRADALAYWCGSAHWTFVVEEGDQVLGTYYIRANQQGGGDHVCNCGFITAPAARGKGVARMMLEHALTEAKRLGFLAMQFNFVVATNTRAIAIWESYGFDVVGRLPRAFLHPREGLVDALVMYRWLDKDAGAD